MERRNDSILDRLVLVKRRMLVVEEIVKEVWDAWARDELMGEERVPRRTGYVFDGQRGMVSDDGYVQPGRWRT